MRHILFSAAIGATALFSANFASASDDSKLNEAIRDFIMKNPEVLIESLQNFQLREQAGKLKEQQAAVDKSLKLFAAKTHHPVAGNPKGDVTIIEFFDYNCPACKMMFESLDSVLKSDKKVKVVFVEYPIFGPQSDENAKLAMAFYALKPEKYYDLHSALMRNKGRVDAELVVQAASGLGIKPETLKAEAAKSTYDNYIKKDRDLGSQMLIQGTPALIIGGKFFGGALTSDELKSHLAAARSAKKN